MRILTNHIGYEVREQKHAVVLGRANDDIPSFNVRRYETGEIVLSGIPVKTGPVHKWRDWHFWTVGFDDVTEEGTYCIECASGTETACSFPFVIQSDVLERNALSNVVFYLKSQRCSGLDDQADRAVTFAGVRAGTVVDIHGGWYDATGDYGKHFSHLCFTSYFNPQQLPLVVWSLLRTHTELARRNNPNFRQYKKRLLDEATFGADFLLRARNPTGSFYISLSALGPEKRPEDRRIMPAMRGFGLADATTKDAYTPKEKLVETTYEAGYRAGAGVAIAALALASTCGTAGDFKSADYLKAAQDVFTFLEEHNRELANDGKENITDDYCALLAAVELYKATHDERYRSVADKRADSLMGRLVTSGSYRNYWRADDGDRPFFHPSDAGLPVVSLLCYLEIANDAARKQVLETVEKSLRFELEVTEAVNNPFGHSRQLVQNREGVRRAGFFFPHDTETAPWWQGENARLASMAAAARIATGHFREDRDFHDKLQTFAWNQLNWILGLNPFDSCMLHASGRNNPRYLFFDSYEYTNCPGGICNGITSGFYDEDDIDLSPNLSATGEDHDWRWAEQWLPHAAWFLLAVATRE